MENVSKVVVDEAVIKGENQPYIVYATPERSKAASSDE
jgi:ATP-dependent Clp protease ATP-binding subunit ClpX